MIRYILHILGWLGVVVFEFGFLHSLSLPWLLIPVGMCIGIYLIFNLRPYMGFMWIVGMGVVKDIHAVEPTGDVVIAVIFGALLIYVIDQHITHMSIYPAVISAGAMAFFWTLLSVIFGAAFGKIISLHTWLVESVESAVVASVTMLILMIVLPYLGRVVKENLQIS